MKKGIYKKTALELSEEKKSFSSNLAYTYKRLSAYFEKNYDAVDCLQDIILDLWEPRTTGQEKLRKWIDNKDLNSRLEGLKLFHMVKRVVNQRVKNEIKRSGKYAEYIDYFSNGQTIDTETAVADSLLKKIKAILNDDENIIFTAYYVRYFTVEKIAKRMKLKTIEVEKALWTIKRKIEAMNIKTDGYDYFIAEVKSVLNEEQQELFNLYHIKRLKQKEVAKKLGVSQANISKRLKTINRKLNPLKRLANIEAFEQRFILPYKPESMPANWYHHNEANGACRILQGKEKEKAIAELKAA